MTQDNEKPDGKPRSGGEAAPTIEIPKGGGALRSIDEKFAVNAANGTCELTVSLPFSKTRSGLDSGLELRYSSGNGNGLFGLGWTLTLPSVQRRTDRKLPRYRDDGGDADVFSFSGADDLVPALVRNGSAWDDDVVSDGTAHGFRYRPRNDSLHSRIERISIDGESSFYWKVTTRENVVTIFGRTAAARIVDPADTTKVFRWLPEWMYDSLGNCLEIGYSDENLTGVPDRVEESHRRAGLAPFTNKHIKRIRYGNKTPYVRGAAPLDPAAPASVGYLFEAVFDYGDHDLSSPSPAATQSWPCRFDPFSDYRAGFEIRSSRLCRRILFFHRFRELNLVPAATADPYLVRSLDFTYRHFQFDGAAYESREVDLITAVRRTHYKRNGAGYASKSLPAIELDYNETAWNTGVERLAPEDVADAPGGAAPANYQWLDLYGDGISGLLTEQAGAWYFKRNEGDGHLAAALPVAPKPSLLGVTDGSLQFQDLDGDGRKQLVSSIPGLQGYFELDDEGRWMPFRAFARNAVVDPAEPNLRFIDLDGDGKPEIVVSEEQVFRWYPSLGTEGYDEPQFAGKPLDEARGAAVVFADGTETIFIADMNGDGLADIVRVRNGDVSYWPNCGYGRFGARVTMRNAPLFDRPEQFRPDHIRLADVSGTGALDLIYVGGGRFRVWLNCGGNAWSEEREIAPFPGTEPPNRIWAFDLLGNGTASIVWSSELPANASAPIRYVDLMGGRKPFILRTYRNNLGKEVRVHYESSSRFAARDRHSGHPWLTTLPFPVMCVSRVETLDRVSGMHLVHELRYRHGYYDHEEREFRGFAMVEETDSVSYERFRLSGATNVVDATLHQPRRRTQSWYHTGAYVRGIELLELYAADYFRNDVRPEPALPPAAIVSDDLPLPDDLREAARACRGMLLRREMYADDGPPLESFPYAVEAHTCSVRVHQPVRGDRRGVFSANEAESITFAYERRLDDPRITHEINAVIDEFGNNVESASIVYGRDANDPSLPSEVQDAQTATRMTWTTRRYTADVDTIAAYRPRLLAETVVHELTGVTKTTPIFNRDTLRIRFHGALDLDFEKTPHAGLIERRLVRIDRMLYAADANPGTPLPLFAHGVNGLRYEQYRLTFTQSLRTALAYPAISDAMLGEGHYLENDGRFPLTDPAGWWWTPMGRREYPANPEQHFFLPDRYIDACGVRTRVRYFSDYHLVIDRTEDDLGNATTATAFDFRFVQPLSVTDPNDNISEVRFDIFGFIAGLTHRGKGTEADDFAGFVDDVATIDVDAFFADPAAHGESLLAHASTRYLYRFTPGPAAAATIARETHHRDAVASGTPSKIRYSFEFSDGSNRVAMTKVQAEPGFAKRCAINPDGTCTITDVDTTPNRRWIGSGREVVNNKGNTVMRYEPFFSVTPAYETAQELVAAGVSRVVRYDPIDRVIRTDYPDGSFSTMSFDAWKKSSSDQNDNLTASDWYATRIGGGLGANEQVAAQRSLLHDGTPDVVHFDSLGRDICSDAHNRYADRATSVVKNEHAVTVTTLDVFGNRVAVRDARGNVTMRYAYDLAGNQIFTRSMDAGGRWSLSDVVQKSLYAWDDAGNQLRSRYDALHRPTRLELLPSGGSTTVIHRTEYGTDKTTNSNLKAVAEYDPSGLVHNNTWDFKGNLLETSRQFTANTDQPDWTNPPSVVMRPGALTTTTRYDALSRVVSVTTPDASTTSSSYSEANLITAVDVSIRGAAARPFISKIRHDAKGQRTRVEYPAVTTEMMYDSLTMRTRRILTERIADGAVLQDLNYTYDPVGNVVRIADGAQQDIFFNNQRVSPQNDFLYDALYRLIRSEGREHIGMNAPVSRLDLERSGLAHPADGTAVQRYVQQYEYDVVGNMTEMVHDAGNGAFTHQWTRSFTPNLHDNHLASSQVGATAESYHYDAHGNLDQIPGLPALTWNETDHLAEIDLGGGGTAHYTYDAAGKRTRKRIVRVGSIVEERLYTGAVEIYTRTNGPTLELRRETLHVMDGLLRLAMVETRTDGTEGPAELIRFQFANRLSTATLELDENGAILTYEEYFAWGSTSFQSSDAARDVPARRYRYAGKERDEESGLYYHGARFYAAWLCRWTSVDPAGIEACLNLYEYSFDNPIRYLDEDGRQPTSDRQRWVAIFNQLSTSDPQHAHVQTLITAMTDPQISGATVQQRTQSILNLTGQLAPYIHFNETTIRAIGSGRGSTSTGDSGFRRELQDSLAYASDVSQQQWSTQHRESSDQVGHFLTAVDMGMAVQRYSDVIDADEQYHRDHPFLWALSQGGTEYGGPTDAAYQNIALLMNMMVGHELVADDAGSGAGASSIIGATFAPIFGNEVSNFEHGRLDLINLTESQKGNSYQDLLLTWIGYTYGQHVQRGDFRTREAAARWLTMMLTDYDLSTVSRNDPFYQDAQRLRGLLQQFHQLQQQRHPGATLPQMSTH